jgi:hypothetical protein
LTVNPILEVAIGVVLVFLVAAVMVSSVTEIISGLFRVRATTLERGIAVMLGSRGKNWLYNQVPLINTSKPPAGIRLRDWWPWYRGAPSPKVAALRPPSYIDAVTFATTLTNGLSAATSETLLARILPDKATREANIRGNLKDPATQAGALKEADDADTLANYLLTQLAPPNALLTVNDVAQIVGDWGTVQGIADSLQVTDPAKAPLEKLLTDAPAPANTLDLVQRVISYSPAISTPSLDKVLQGLGAIPLSADARNSLVALAQRADGEIAKFRQQVEDWFDREMNRVSGVYNRWSQIVMILVGLVVAIGLNISAYTIGRALWVDQTLRAKAVAAATQTVSTTTTTPSSSAGGSTPPTTAASTTPTYDDLKSFGLPVGWNKASWPSDGGDIILHVLGWVAVAIAASFGAPFWFDTLNKFVNLRTSGPPPSTAADQRAKVAAASGP